MPSYDFRFKRQSMREVLNSDGVRSDMHRRASVVAGQARSLAPVVTGRYRASIKAGTETTDRAVGRVIADSDHASAVEAHLRVLGRALGAASGVARDPRTGRFIGQR